MRTSNLAKLVSLQLLAVAFMSDAHATSPRQTEPRRETIFVPSCSPDEFQPQWVNCVATPGRPGTIRDWGDLR
jgi:hypothetical protein